MIPISYLQPIKDRGFFRSTEYRSTENRHKTSSQTIFPSVAYLKKSDFLLPKADILVFLVIIQLFCSTLHSWILAVRK